MTLINPSGQVSKARLETHCFISGECQAKVFWTTRRNGAPFSFKAATRAETDAVIENTPGWRLPGLSTTFADVCRRGVVLAYLLRPEQCQHAGGAYVFALPAYTSPNKTQSVPCKAVPESLNILNTFPCPKPDVPEI